MKDSKFEMRARKTFSTLAAAAVLALTLAGFASNAAAQTKGQGRAAVENAAMQRIDESSIKTVSADELKVETVGALGGFSVLAPSAVTPGSVYSNVTNFTGSGFSNGGAAADPANAANTITRLLADDLTLIRGDVIRGFQFSVANFNTVAVSARPRVRIYAADGAGGGPGTLLVAVSFAAISFPANNVSLFTYNPQTVLFTAPQKIWAGMVFDNNAGATGATAAQLNNLGQGTYDPPNLGASADLVFFSTANGSFTASNPAGATSNAAGNPVANLGWEMIIAAPTAGNVSVGGRVTNQYGRGVSRAIVTMTDGAGAVRSAQTNYSGFYKFEDVTVGETYVVRARAKRLEFAPQVLNINDEMSDLNFAGF